MNQFTNQSKVDKVWVKAKPVRGKNPNDYRKDSNGKLIRRASHGSEGEYGWEIDHIRPKSKGGSDDIRNLRPLHWKDNRKKGNKYP